MKKRLLVQSVSALAIAGLFLSGCASDAVGDVDATKDPTPSQSAPQEPTGDNEGSDDTAPTENTAETAAAFLTQFYADWAKGPDSVTIFDDLEKDLTEAIGVDLSGAPAPEDPIEFYNSLPKENQKKSLEVASGYNPQADKYDTTGMTDGEATILHMLHISYSTMLAMVGENQVVTAEPSDIVITGDTASISAGDLKVTFNGEEAVQGDENSGFTDISLTAKSGSWKVDGPKFLDALLNATN